MLRALIDLNYIIFKILFIMINKYILKYLFMHER